MTCFLTVRNIVDDQSKSTLANFVAAALTTTKSSKNKGNFLVKLLRKDNVKHKAIGIVAEWQGAPVPIIAIDPLNLASMQLFTQHTAVLEGLNDNSGTGEGSIWPNLPYWMYSIWLPLEQSKRPMVMEIGGMPTLVGTAKGLLSDLQEIQKKSKLSLGTFPKNFDLMIDDRKAFNAIANLQLNDQEIIQWVWLSLKIGAEYSIKSNKPLYFES